VVKYCTEQKMLLGGFSLEILVNNVPLPEITEKVEAQKVNVSHVLILDACFVFIIKRV
jgi:hypothetical protein